MPVTPVTCRLLNPFLLHCICLPLHCPLPHTIATYLFTISTFHLTIITPSFHSTITHHLLPHPCPPLCPSPISPPPHQTYHHHHLTSPPGHRSPPRNAFPSQSSHHPIDAAIFHHAGESPHHWPSHHPPPKEPPKTHHS
ncbi:hypothetical protein E2C01_068734 [Portunus trituberculatus]|uniref:Uncharacterized protein n=1 Tax=Portunus trituberculatus TaxID=210409 RepID=A0A5B7HXC1_PORTR|nr:hypothetical protein [Portunus trituberculatus]